MDEAEDMTVKFAATSVLVFCLVFGQAVPVRGSEPYLCNPQSAILKFRLDGREVSVEVLFHRPESLCTLDYGLLETTDPAGIRIWYGNRSYDVDQSCMKKMPFDLHGVTVDFGPEDRFAVWFQESHKAVPDFVEREKQSVGIWFDGSALECSFYPTTSDH